MAFEPFVLLRNKRTVKGDDAYATLARERLIGIGRDQIYKKE